MLFVPRSGAYMMLNEVSALVVDALGSATTASAVVDAVLAEYDAARDEVVSDVEALLQTLKDKGAVEEVPL